MVVGFHTQEVHWLLSEGHFCEWKGNLNWNAMSRRDFRFVLFWYFVFVFVCVSPFAGATEAVNKPYSQNSADNIDDGSTQIRR